ncbi:hypothetical protein RBH94_15110 [Aestuariibaculum sp. YM273]|uniref:hypothetical protein n=1 Tax=Aestuariibaculum sp. YM273 TaxID=3070659 RepID=UPI0027DAE326|nr:hypothetical protein [Aestuariibaculum sp. YM273]WMI65380.1 hypothetical protein RBH94_15110 [Aestuariibaculum sp. YM273]
MENLNNKVAGNYSKQFNGIFNLTGITANELVIMNILLSFALNDKHIFISDKELSNFTNGLFNVRTIQNIIKKCTEKGYIKRKTTSNQSKGYGGKTRIITINENVYKVINGELDSIPVEDIPSKQEPIKADLPSYIKPKVTKEPKVISIESGASKTSDETFNLKDVLTFSLGGGEYADAIHKWFIKSLKHNNQFQTFNQANNPNEIELPSNMILKLLVKYKSYYPQITDGAMNDTMINIMLNTANDYINEKFNYSLTK